MPPPYWNEEHADKTIGSGSAGRKGIGTEVVRALIEYAKELQKQGQKVPSDVAETDRANAQDLYSRRIVEAHKNEKGEIDWVYLPLTEVRATCAKGNEASRKILERVFVRENQGEKGQHPTDSERWLFTLKLG